MYEVEELVLNIDEYDMGNQLVVVEYIEDIYGFYCKMEIQSCVLVDYMFCQLDINEKMCVILIDWFIEVYFKFKFMLEMLFLMINLID